MGANYRGYNPVTGDDIWTIAGEQQIASGGQLLVEDGGEIEVKSGGILDILAGATFTVATTLAMTIAALTAGDAYSGLRVAVTAPLSNNAYGMAAYFDTLITGATAGHSYGVGSWINSQTDTVFTAGHIIVPFEGGIYTGQAQADARIVFAGQHQAILNGAPASLHAWRLNTTQTITALIAAANAGSVAFQASAAETSTPIGSVPMFDIVGHGIGYVRLYDDYV